LQPSDLLASSEWKYPIDGHRWSLFFYEVRRSAAAVPVSWRGESLGNADGDFHGGWYDAGDHKVRSALYSAVGWRSCRTLQGNAWQHFDGQTNCIGRYVMDYRFH
jgi:hypothetical protein